MVQFEFKNPRVIYRLQKGSSRTISNDRMTDELAIDFLRINPARIELFRTYPENWQELVDASEAQPEPQRIKGITTNSKEDTSKKKVGVVVKADLEDKKLKDLKELYPDIPVEFGQSKKDFIQKILNQ